MQDGFRREYIPGVGWMEVAIWWFPLGMGDL